MGWILLEELSLFENPIFGMIQQFPVHRRATAGTQQRVLTEGGEEQLSEGGSRQHTVTSGIEGPGGGKERGYQFPHLLVAVMGIFVTIVDRSRVGVSVFAAAMTAVGGCVLWYFTLAREWVKFYANSKGKIRPVPVHKYAKKTRIYSSVGGVICAVLTIALVWLASQPCLVCYKIEVQADGTTDTEVEITRRTFKKRTELTEFFAYDEDLIARLPDRWYYPSYLRGKVDGTYYYFIRWSLIEYVFASGIETG